MAAQPVRAMHRMTAVAGLIGGLYDFAVATFGLWNENFTSRCCELGSTIADKAKLVFSCNTSAALLGMGFSGW